MLRPLSTCLALALVVGCSEGPASGPAGSAGAGVAAQATPAAAVERLLEALRGDDQGAILAALTDEAAAILETSQTLTFDSQDLESYVLGETLVDGERARTEATLVESGESRELAILTRRVDSDWRVFGLEMEMGDGVMTVDLEHLDDLFGGVVEGFAEELGAQLTDGLSEAFEDAQVTWEQGGTPEEIVAQRRAFESIEPLTEAEFDAAWRVDVRGAGRDAATVIEEVLAGTGLALDTGAAALGGPLDLELVGVSRVEAVERIAAAVGAHPVWPAPEVQGWFGEEPEPEALTLVDGPRPLPAVSAGPFLVEVTELVEDTPQPTGRLTVTVRALGLPAVALAFQDDMVELLDVQRVRGAGDVALVDEEVQYLGSPEVREGYLTYSIGQDLTGLLRAVEAIEALAGEVRLAVPTAVEATTFESGGDGVATLDRGRLEVSEWSESVRFALTGDGVDDLRLLASPRRADGSALGIRFWSAYGWGEKVDASLDCPEAPAAVDLKLCVPTELTYAFELPPIPLVGYAQRPAALEPLAFDGPAPIAVKLTGALAFANGMAEAPLRVTNVCNKDVASAMVEFVYLDAAGEALEDFPHTLTGEWDFETGETAPVAAAGAEADLLTHAAFAPESTVQIRFRVQSLEFTDGTTWEADER